MGFLFSVIVLIGFPWLWLRQNALRRRIDALESRQRDTAAPVPDAARTETPTSDDATAPRSAPTPRRKPNFARAQAQVARDQAESVPLPPAPKRSPAYVLSQGNVDALGGWLRANWTLAIAAVSLILGGLFMVQYGVERGLLSPRLRILGALALGVALIGAGEWVRRRHGDESPLTRHLPSTFAGAGIVVLFIACLSAHALYGLIGSGLALAAAALVAAAAILMGWLYAPFLPAIGLLGGLAAPVLVGGSSGDPIVLYPYFTVLGLAGLAIDSPRRTAWLSTLALIVAMAGLELARVAQPDALAFLLAALALAAGTLIVPQWTLVPRLSGPPVPPWNGSGRPAFPALLGAAGIAIACYVTLAIGLDGLRATDQSWLALGGFVGLFAVHALWLRRAAPLDPLAVLPVLGFLALAALQPLERGALWTDFAAFAQAEPETALPTVLWWILGGAAIVALAAFQRLRMVLHDAPDAPGATWWTTLAATILPATALLVERLWTPRDIIGAYPVALAVMAGAALLVVLTQARARLGGAFRQRETGMLAASALLMIALALFLLLTKDALTLGLAVLMVLAVALDRRFGLRILVWVAQLGAAVIGYRLVVDPGVDFSAVRSSWPAFLASHLGAIAGFEAARRLARPNRRTLVAVAESGLATTLGLLVMLLIARAFDGQPSAAWFPGLLAAIWASVAMGQVWRLRGARGAVRVLRAGLSGIAALSALAFMGLQVVTSAFMLKRPVPEVVVGPPIFDTIAVAWLPLAAVLGICAWIAGRSGLGQARTLRIVSCAGAALAVIAWGFLEIRRLWRGPDLSAFGPSDGELYTYTLAMLAASLAVLAVAVLRRSELLRRIAMIGVALTIAKVFLLDTAGLSGLTRVVSFVGLGLALAGLAWVNRRIDGLWSPRDPKPD
ncbi:DUF2339 domain-containing protein [Maribius pontilimi]|uniref:DUF2339 domain-containing protein n=1 Tax=Palleronia pontilimi TaxID=1964209 RepID=A0A934IJJ1_9RHOB|nr:DUF2339 domain-containing protein [Palleronia pontilimi]MBJ3764157.1 DUF2339 domain-containing protein [Palleronia pontilimi]